MNCSDFTVISPDIRPQVLPTTLQLQGPKGLRVAGTLATLIPLSSFWLVGFRSCHSHQSEQVDVSLADTVTASWARSTCSPLL